MSDSQLRVADDPEQFVCPNGHTSWVASDEYFWCYDCSRLHGVDPEFDELENRETGDQVSPDGVGAS